MQVNKPIPMLMTPHKKYIGFVLEIGTLCTHKHIKYIHNHQGHITEKI